MTPWTKDRDDALRRLHGTMPIADVATALGTTKGAIRGRVTKLGIAKFPAWTADEEARLIALYEAAGETGHLNLKAFAEEIGRNDGNICRKARLLGLSRSVNRKKVAERKERTPMFASAEDRSAYMSDLRKRQIRENGHPRGMAGKKHSAETLQVLSRRSSERWESLTEEEREAHTAKSIATRVKNGFAPPHVARGTWHAGWRDVGGKRNFYRSRWEANYARYLQWLKELGEIAEWQHEPETFWFEAIRRGVRSYKPDFRVWETNGSSALHEVKGWMDDRSRTCLRRMAKYYPAEKIVLVDGKAYRSIRIKVMRLIEGWEDHPRDSHA